jgi:N12 class adenine-specific DNA methylase
MALRCSLPTSGKPSDLRKVLSTYNNEAASPAAGQIDMFSGDVTSKEEILKNVNEYFRNATPKEQQALIDAAVAERKRRAEAAEPAGGDEASEQATVVAGSGAEPQQPVVASEEPVKGNEPDADALAREAEEKLSERITDTEDEWTEPSEYGEIYKHRMFVDGNEVIKVDAPDKSKNYPGTYYEIDGKQFGDLYEVANYIDGNEQPLSAKIEAASAEVNTDPTEAQKEAGNYKKGHVQVGTFDITIEQPQGSVRKGTDADGKQWESKMNNTYGYIRGAVGVDGDHIDVFLSNDIDGWNGRKVFVVDQYNPDGSFDEHKVMLGFNDQDEAKGDYLANYEQGWENGRRIDITGVNLEDFEKWIESSKRKTKPFGEYSSVKKDVVEINTPEEAGYSITPSTYTNKKGKTSDVSLLTFDHDLTADQERAVKEFAKERTGEGRFAPARGWKDRESGGWMFRSEEDARKAAEMVGNEEAVADNQPMTAQELRDAVEPKKPTTSKKIASKKPANRVESVPTEEPIEPEKPKYEVSDEEMNGLMNDIRDILGIGDDEGDAGFKFRDPDELTAEQRQKLMSVGQRLAMAMVERGNESFGDYASMMVKALGDKVRPWLKAFYGGLEYVPGYDKYALTPYEEVKAFDVENFDKPTKDVMAQANMIVEEGKAQVAAEKANNELKATRNEQRKETEKQTAANTDAVAAEAKSVASEATALAETSSDEQALTGAAERVDETLDKVNKQLALLGYYEADEVEKDYNEAYGYMRNAEKKAVKDAANLASQLISDLNLSHYEASHSKQTDKKGNRKKKPLAVSNISPIGGDVSIHLPLEEGRELYLTIGVEPRAAKGVDGFGGSDLEVTHIMFRVDHPEGTGNDRYGRNVFVDSNVTYSDLLKQVQREAYKYLIGSGVTNEGEYAAGDKVQYSTDGGRTWTDAVVVQPNDEGGIRIDTGLAPVMWVNAHPDQLRHKPSESAEPKHEAVGDFYEDGINEDAVAALPEDTAIQLHVVDILNPGMTDHSMKSKIESLNTLLPKISDKKLSKLDKEYGDDKDMGTHIKAEVARRAKDGGVQPTSSEEPADKPKPASKKNATKKVKPEQPVGDLFAGLFDEQKDNGLQRNDDAVRTETVPADNSGQQQGLRESQGSPRKTAAQEGGRPDGGRGGQSTGKDRAVSAGLHGLTHPKNTRNNHSERGADHAPTSVNGRIEANIKAIELAHELLESGETATPEQMSVLRQFSGWGGLGAAFSDGGYDWKQRERNKKIRELLGEEAYEQAVMSANSAYYTPAYVVDTLWDIANQLGFKGGNILEGSAGIGNILGQMPTTVSERSNIHAIEIDGTSGGILSLLYPDAKVEIQGFEQTRIPNGSVDLAITNVPFVTGLRVNDTTGDSDLSKKFHNIHDFCIAKNVRKLREGGLGIFISSNGTLDNSKALRDWVVNEGGSDFIGAFRMNNKTFGGTTVTSDIIVIRKRVNGQKSAQAIDVSSISGERTAEYEEPGARKAKQLSMDYNKYFIEHPDHMAGEMRFAFEEGDTFRPTSKGLYPVSGKDQGKMLVDFVKSFTEEDSSKATTTDHHDVSLVLDASADGKKLGEMYMKDGQIVLASFGGYYPLEVNDKKIKGHTKQECFTAYAAIKSALADVMQYQTENESDAGLKPLIAKLNKAYDAFVNTYGHFNKNNQLAWLRNDVDYPNVFSLETYKEQGDGKGGVVKTYDKADVMKGRVVEKESEPHPENVKDGVVVSMFKNGRIDVPYIASQLGKSEAEVKREIIDSGLGFEDPTTRQMEVSYQYLSGNVREKLKQAEANNENGEYSKNIKALQDVVPMNIPAHLIDFTLGSSWLDPKLYDEYVKERTDIDVHFTAAGGTWFMKAPTYGVNVEKNRAMGIVSEMLKKTIMGHELISAAIQNKSIIVSRTEKHYDGTTETITDREATAACAAKIDEIRQDFKDWARGKMQSDADLSARMEQEYNDRFNNYVPMSIPDDFVPEYFGGATHKFKMRSHQGKAIVRGTMQPLLLAHEVGTGKTFTLISTAMEMRRLGTARKPMIVVQNATVGQFAASAKELYPNAKILTLEDNDRNAEGRKNFYAKIKYNDWDMIVVPQSTFEFIPDSDERQMQFVQDKIDEKMLVLEQMREADSSGRDPITRRAEKELADLQAEMAALSEGISKKRTANNEKKKAVAKQNAAVKAQEMLDRRTDDVENFDDMGIDALLIDEAHEYKHLGFATAMQRGVKGVDPSYSKKSQGVYLKTQAILEKNNGRNVIFATGTPISNTAAEIWTFMRYLMPKDTMKEYGIYYFDDFVRNFGNIQQMPEFNTSGKFKEVNRFAGYVNLPELVRIWSGVADTVLTKDQTELVKKIPEMEGGKAQDIYLPQTRALRSVMKYVREELERFDKMSGKEKKENSSIPLTMYGIAQGAAVDARLVEMHAEDDPRSKTNEAVRQTLRSLKETDDYKGTVAIFADHYQNKRSGFNLYEDIKKKLIQQGVPESEVVVMKPGMTIKKKLEIFDKVNRGEVRVILGSTATLGTGVNIQERLHTLIHLDAPNRPMDYTQRNGRILRQGNLHKQWNKPVRVLRFGVEDSLDVTAYQRLKTKGAIADSVMEGDRLMQDSMNNRVLEEEEDVFGDTVAQLSGSEYALLKNNAEKNVRKYESRKKQWEADQTYIHNAKPKLEGQIKAAEQRAEEANAHLLAVQKAFPDGKFTEITVGKQKFGSVDAMSDFIKEHNKKILDAVKAMKEHPGNAAQTNTLTLSLGGYDFVVKTEMSRETQNIGGSLFAEIHRKMTYSCPELGLNNVPVKQSLLRNAVEDITENVITGRDFAERFDIATRMVQHGKSELEQLKQREGKPFEFGKELEEAKRQFEEYSEAMKVEMAEKEKKYAEMDASVDAATDVVADDEDETAEDKTKFRLLDEDDPKAMELESLPESELVPVYRNVQAFEDDALGSPMAFTDAETGERRTLEGRRWNYSAPPKVELTEEQQRKLDELNKNGYIMVDGKKSTELQINDGLKFVKPKTKEAQLQYFLKKNPEDKGTWAAYDPYDHAIETPLNTQFGEAYKRPNLVVVRSLIPKSEIDEPFHADYALLPTGAHQWNNGRTLYLSRWSKIDKVLTREEEAKLIDEYWKKHPGKREELKTHRDYNRFVPQVRRELEKMGYRFELDGKELTPEESLALDKQNWESRDVIPGREGHTPFVSNEDIARINAKMAGKWVGEPKEAMESAMSERVTELSERLHTPVRIIRTEEEVAALPSVRQRRMKGSFNPMTGEVTIVVPNNANMADIENTFVHEVVGHDGLRVLFPDEAKLNNALDELYRVSKDEIRGTIDRMAQKMYDAEVDRIREKKRKEHVANGEDANASYYADMAAAHAEAGKKREQFKRDATEEYGADLAGRIGEKGFEKMSAEELTFWGKLKAMLQKALQKLLDGLKIPSKRKWGDKDWAFVLHEAYERKKNGGKPTVFDAADTEVMRRKTGFGEMKFSDGKHEQNPQVATTIADMKQRVTELFEKAKTGEFVGKPASIGMLSVDGKAYLEKLSGLKFKEFVDFVLNPSDLNHIRSDHYGENEKDKGNNVPLTDEDIQNMVDVLNQPDGILYGVDKKDGRKLFFFLKHAGNGLYNLTEVCSTKKGNLTAKSFFKSKKKGISQRVMEIKDSLLPTSVTYSGEFLSSDAKIPTLFEINEGYSKNVADEGIMFRDGDMGLEETITKMKAEASQANADNWQAKQDAMRAIGGNLNKLRQAMARQRAYDLWTVKSVTDLAQILLDNGLLDDMSKYEYNRILSAVKNVHGKKDISKYVDKVMDVMVGNQLRAGETRLGRLERIRASKVDAKGIDVQAQLDADGQAIMKAFRSAKPLSVEELDKKILEATDRMSNTNEQIAANAALEHTGLLLAKQYVDGVSESKKAVAQFKDEVKKAEEEMNAGQMTEEAFKQFKDAIDETIKQLKIDRIEAYNNLADSLGGVLGESVERAKQWKEAEKERVNKIHHLANSDMQGRELKGHRPDTKAQWLANSWVARFAFEPLSTFDQMLKMFGSKNPNGEGYMQDYFMRHWIDSTDNEQLLKERYQKQMDDKAAEIFGKKYKYLDLYGYVQTQKSATVKYYDGADMREYEIAQDGLLYLYAVEKMPMGKATNRRMGITDETMEQITDALDPKLKEFADWVQEDFLPSIGMESDVVYTRMFGTHMDSIEKYFPFVRDKDALKRDVENGQSNSDNDRISVQTGAIKKRVASVALWNLKDMSFLDVLAKHVGEMSHWQSFAELNRDIGTLLSYNRFKQQVMNMSSVYGSGKELWKRFEQCAAIATDCYEPQRAKFDQLMVQGAKGVTMGKIAFRPFTALKQTLSLPAFFGEVNAVDMAEALATGGIPALKWSWKNMPNFRKRILSRTTGDYRLRETEYDNKIMKAASYGMLPNIGVDAWTIAVGSHCVYKAQKRKYLRWGMEEERAERRAVQDAEMCFNKSQQSSEGAYMAPIQIDHTFYATSAMLFRNSSTAYTRETHNSVRNLKRIFSGEVSEDYVAKQILRTIHPNAEDYWSDAEWAKARAEAKREIRSAKVKNGVNLVMFGWILPWLWRIGGTSVLLALTGDNEERAKQLIDATKQSVFAPMEGLTYGDVFEGGINKVLGYAEQSWAQQGRENPIISDMRQMLKEFDYDWVQGANDVLNILGGMTTGVNPQTFTDWTVAIMDFCGNDAKTSHECALLAARLLNCPQSQLDKVYLEELDMTAAEAKGMTPAEVAERYARYKMMREAPLTGWMRSAEKSDSISEKKQQKVFRIAKEKLNSRMETEETKQLLSDYDAIAKQETALSKIKKTDRAAYREGMKQLRQSNDMRQHMRLKRYKHDMKELTSKYLRCKSAEERDSIVSTMFSTRAKMLEDIGRLKQQ